MLIFREFLISQMEKNLSFVSLDGASDWKVA